MRINKPKFWDQKISLVSLILLPFTILVKLIILLRKRLIKGEKFNIPVICIGNIYLEISKEFSRFLILLVEKLCSSSLNVLISLLIRLKVLLFNKLLSSI